MSWGCSTKDYPTDSSCAYTIPASGSTAAQNMCCKGTDCAAAAAWDAANQWDSTKFQCDISNMKDCDLTKYKWNYKGSCCTSDSKCMPSKSKKWLWIGLGVGGGLLLLAIIIAVVMSGKKKSA